MITAIYSFGSAVRRGDYDGVENALSYLTPSSLTTKMGNPNIEEMEATLPYFFEVPVGNNSEYSMLDRVTHVGFPVGRWSAVYIYEQTDAVIRYMFEDPQVAVALRLMWSK